MSEKIHACEFCGNFHDPVYSDCNTGEPILSSVQPAPAQEEAKAVVEWTWNEKSDPQWASLLIEPDFHSVRVHPHAAKVICEKHNADLASLRSEIAALWREREQIAGLQCDYTWPEEYVRAIKGILASPSAETQAAQKEATSLGQSDTERLSLIEIANDLDWASWLQSVSDKARDEIREATVRLRAIATQGLPIFSTPEPQSTASVFHSLESPLQHQLTEALATCEGKDEALKAFMDEINQIRTMSKGLHVLKTEIVPQALALQPSSTALSDYLRPLVDALTAARERIANEFGECNWTDDIDAALARFQATPIKEA